HRIPESKRVADGEHDVADLQAIRSAERDGGEILAIGLEYREIGLRIGAFNVRAYLPSVGEHQFDVVGPVDDMMVREDVTFPCDDDARAEGVRAARRPARREMGEK